MRIFWDMNAEEDLPSCSVLWAEFSALCAPCSVLCARLDPAGKTLCILIGIKLWYPDDRSDSNSWAGTLQGPEVWPGLRREHDPEKPGARNVASTEARA